MKTKTKQLPTWKETIKLNHRAFALFYKRYPQVILSRLFYVIWTSLTPYVGIYLSALIIDELAGSRNVQHLQFLVIMTLLTAAVIALVTAILHKWKETQNAGLWFKFEHILTEKLLDMDYVALDHTGTAELLDTIKQNQNGGGWGLFHVITNCEKLCSALLNMIGGLSLTVSLFVNRVPQSAGDYALLDHPLVVVAVLAAMLGVTLLAPMLTNKGDSYWALNADIHNFANRRFSFFGFLGYYRQIATDVRMYRQDRLCDKYNCSKEDAFASKGPFARYAKGPMGIYLALGAAASVLFTGIAYVYVCLKAWAGAFGLGAVTQYIASITKVYGGVSKLITTVGDMRNNTPFLRQVFAFLDIPNDMYQGSLTVEKRNDRNYEVEFNNVSFRYPDSEQFALRNVNIKFKIGNRLAVVGLNGSGKTTFIKLLCRLYDPTEGEILLNGIDIRKYNYAEYMNLFSVVFQDFNLFALPLGQNVAAGIDYNNDRVIDCLDKAGFAHKLAQMPQGIDTYLYTDYNKAGVNISGGEAQKIAIARALYKDAPFIILDEPTAALDPIAEAEIYSKFDEIAGDHTAIYISHRLSSCIFCDEIAVFDQGSVIQHGTHAALLADRKGQYYQLWNAQAQYYTK